MKAKSTILGKNPPKVKGSVAWNLYYHPKEMHAKAEAVRKDISSHHMKKVSEKEKTDYQRKTGRGYNE